MKLVTAKNIGFCFGVRRTVQTAEKLLERYRCLYSIGDIVHNPLVMNRLKAKGLKVVESEKEVKDGPFIVRSHGIGPDTICRLKSRGVKIYDATCPSVKKIQALIKKLDRKKYLIIIIGNEKHPEVVGLKEYGSRVCVFRETASYHLKNNNCYKSAVIGQTTLSFRDYLKSADSLLHATNFKETVVYNTICRVTGERQEESAEISKMVDMVLVLGGKTSSNTTKLYENCCRFNKRVFYIETMDELKKISLEGIKTVGLVSGTSTPQDFILAVSQYIKKKKMGGAT